MEKSDGASSEPQQVPKAALHITTENRGSELPRREHETSGQASGLSNQRLASQCDNHSGPAQSNVSQTSMTVDILEFQAKIEKFISERADMFDKVMGQDSKEGGGAMKMVPTLHNYQGEESYKYAEPEALEFHMRVDSQIRTERFFELVMPGDVIEGHVTSMVVAFKSLSVQVTSFVGSHKFRELADLDIQGRISFDNLSEENKEREKIFEEMQLMDVIQGVVISCQDDVLSLSFRESHVKQFCPNGELPTGAQLGYTSGKVPKREKQGSLEDFLRHLEDDPGFGNPSCTDNLKMVLGIGPGTSGVEPLEPGMRPTLLRDIQMADYQRGDYHQALRKVQRGKWSMETVEVGVKAFKSGDHVKAMALLCHALGIDPENVEGLVARGALYANGGRFNEAIRDFERALTVKHTHRNARKYLVETQVAYGEELEKKGQCEEAMRCYREALADDPGQTVARERLEHLKKLAEKQEAEKREQERKKMEDEKTLRKIQKFLDREREKESRKAAKKVKLTKKKKTKPAKKQKRRSSGSSKHSSTKRSRKDSKQYSSSDSESTYSDTSRTSSGSRSRSRSRSYSSDGSSPHRKLKHYPGKSRKRRSRSSRSRSKSRSYSSDQSSHHCKHGHQSPRKSRRGRSPSSTLSESSPQRPTPPSHQRKRTPSSHGASSVSCKRSRSHESKSPSPKRSKRRSVSPRKRTRSESSRSPVSSYKNPTRKRQPLPSSRSRRKRSPSPPPPPPPPRKRKRTDSFKSSRSGHRSSLDSNSPSKSTGSKSKSKGH